MPLAGRDRVLPALSGLLLACCFPPLHPLLLPFVALVPLAVHVTALPASREGRRAAARAGALFGAVYFGILLYWIPVALVWFTPLAIPAYLATVVALALLSALFTRVVHGSVGELGVPIWLALPVAWTGTEWLRAHLPDTLAFPWLGLGTSLTGFPRVVGFAELVGARGVGLWIALVNGLVAAILLRAPGRRARLAAALVVVATVPPAWGVWRASSLPLRPMARVAVVQPDIPEHLKLDAARAEDSTRASLSTLLPSVRAGTVDLVVLPEVVFPSLYPEAPERAPALAFLEEQARILEVPLLFGALGYSSDARGRSIPYNSAFLLEPTGLAPFRYDKRALVPWVERVPFLPRRWEGGAGPFGGYGRGEGWPLARVGAVRYGVLICYESSYPGLARRMRREGADVLVNVTNDAWYGRDPWYARTSALWQHPAHLVMRAIENRVGVARAANTGISMFVDPLGRVQSSTELFRADVLSDVVMGTDVVTWYTRLGDVTGAGAALGTLVLLLASWRAGRRSRRARQAPGGLDLDPTGERH